MLDDIVITIDSSGNITSVVISGVDEGITATVTHEGGNVFGFITNNGNYGGFMTDSSRAYAAFAVDDLTAGAVQKGASGSAGSYAVSDIWGSWSGDSAYVVSPFDLNTTGTASATVIEDPTYYATFTGTSSISGDFSGVFDIYDSAYGVYLGSYADSAGTGFVDTALTPDKQFAGTRACESGGFYPDDCLFYMWRKQ